MTQPPAGQPPRGPHPPRGHRGPAAFGPPQGGHGYGPPQRGFGPPPGGPGTPPRGFGPPPGLPQGPPQGPPLGPQPPAPPQGERLQPKKGPRGKAIAIVVAMLVVLGLGGFAAWKLVGPGAGDSAPAAADGGDGAAAAAGAPSSCSLVSGEDLNAVLGDGGWTALDTGAAVGRVYDSRLLAGVPKSCWVTDSLNEKLSRVARYDGGDAAARFAEEKRKAQSGAFLGKDVSAGDEAFCTTPDESSSAAGALVRRGGTLIYVGTTAAGADADAGCALAVQLVEKVR